MLSAKIAEHSWNPLLKVGEPTNHMPIFGTNKPSSIDRIKTPAYDFQLVFACLLVSEVLINVVCYGKQKKKRQ